jgi:ribosomal protein S18 acetylase RimI-like enzyme
MVGEEIVGVTMTRDEWVSDLWVRCDCRRIGIGGKLLAHAERKIQGRGYHTLRLRVVKSNTRAVTEQIHSCGYSKRMDKDCAQDGD